ncbi:glycogen debranching N-terminal domain-containing protein [Arthrobacter sp. NPDC058288]|uniref:glycogen debranching N-terminal domain-containing protein n=1 Tax=Arthrobacter sp. NPDC058288 TaxID=3346424 RepID=UPI0036E7E0D1
MTFKSTEVSEFPRRQITVRNYSLEPAECVISLRIDADFADLFEVKEARIQRRWEETRQPDRDTLTIRAVWQEVRKDVVIHAPGAGMSPGS